MRGVLPNKGPARHSNESGESGGVARAWPQPTMRLRDLKFPLSSQHTICQPQILTTHCTHHDTENGFTATAISTCKGRQRAHSLPLLLRMVSQVARTPVKLLTQRSSNLLFPREDKSENKLLFACRTCSFTEEAPSSCVMRHEIASTVGATAGVTAEVAQDPTVGHSLSEAQAAQAALSEEMPCCTMCGMPIMCEECGEESAPGFVLEAEDEDPQAEQSQQQLREEEEHFEDYDEDFDEDMWDEPMS